MKTVSRYRAALPLMLLLLMAGGLFAAGELFAADWQPAHGPLATRWAKDVSPINALPEYPRPQMVRKEWQNLNGLWDYAIRPKDDKQPEKFDGQILVPYPVESALSGVMKRVDEPNRVWYRRTFTVPKEWAGKRVWLRFGAVNWESIVWVNGKRLGNHRGGYDGFDFAISDALKADGEQEIVVSAWNPINAGTQPRGKQVRKPGGIFYTPTTGIWQTVWIEPVPETAIDSATIVPDIDKKLVRVTVKSHGDRREVRLWVASDPDASSTNSPNHSARVWVALDPGDVTTTIEVPIEDPKLWSPESPYLYGLHIETNERANSRIERQYDSVECYFGMRKISIAKDDNGVTRIFLNNKPQFMIGPLDQGFWPDGIYTAPTDEALRYDIEMTRKLGFNMARKHVKVEPDRWYYWADKLGLMVFQDMPSGDRGINGSDPDLTPSQETADQFKLELQRLIDGRRNHPSIVTWVVFNEGWGQHDTAELTKWVKEYDPTRLVDSASGWTDRHVGDVHDIHAYPGPGTVWPEEHRAAVLGEFGGLGLPIEGHTWQSKSNWGYRSFTDRAALTDAYLALMQHLHPQIGDPGTSAAVYTQTTDVETEVNGLMTYDREIVKPDIDKLAAAHRQLFLPPPKIKTILPTSEREAHDWHYTLDKPADEWAKADFDDAAWKTGPAGFGTEGTPGAVVRTEWKTPDIWLRRTVDLADAKFNSPSLMLHHDDDAEVYINGVLAVKTGGYVTGYEPFAILDEARRTLHAGKNTIAIHCHQKTGGQYIDVGIVDWEEK